MEGEQGSLNGRREVIRGELRRNVMGQLKDQIYLEDEQLYEQIDKDTQLARFQERQNNPEKQWKITDEDWRNREKWDEYEVAVNEMLQKTNTEYAPWHILESVDKKYARIKALKIVIEEIKKYV